MEHRGTAEYKNLVRRVVTARRDEIQGDLDRAKYLLRRHEQAARELERKVASMEALLSFASDREPARDQQGLTLHAAMAAVLQLAPEGMMRAADLAAEIDHRGLYKMRDGRPVEAQQIHARVGHYGHLFERNGTFIKLAGNEP